MGLKLHALGFVLDEADARSRLVMRMSVRFMTFDRAGAGFRYRSTQSCVAAQDVLKARFYLISTLLRVTQIGANLPMCGKIRLIRCLLRFPLG